jgi:CHAT domain-containing protein
VSIFETQRSIYNTLRQVLIAQEKTNVALEIAERGRARAFVELLNQQLLADSKDQSKMTSPDINQIQQIAKTQNTNLVQYSIIYDISTTEGKPQAKESELYIWLIKPTGKVTFRQVDLKSLRTTTGGSPLRKLVAQTLESLGVGEDRNGIFEVTLTNPTANPEHQTKSLKQLHQLLIQPIADLLPSNPEERIIFIPHEDLFRVPFPALIDSDGKYLIEKHTILTAPSIQALELTHKQQQNGSRSTQGALVVGNPSPMPSGFQPLKGAEKEALDVAQLLRTQPLIGSQATEPAVLQQLPNARIIHLATHGTFNEQQPLLGGVALAQTGKDTQNDGLLTAEEIFNLNSEGKLTLNAELLVLSACNTGRGRITGDGVIGLSRSFIAAGVPSVIVSLWSVPDAPTAELMSEFYTNLYQKKLDKAQALRQAMLKMMEKHRDNPRAWAAFTLIGEAQ